jgi:hypothetical protein
MIKKQELKTAAFLVVAVLLILLPLMFRSPFMDLPYIPDALEMVELASYPEYRWGVVRWAISTQTGFLVIVWMLLQLVVMRNKNRES